MTTLDDPYRYNGAALSEAAITGRTSVAKSHVAHGGSSEVLAVDVFAHYRSDAAGGTTLCRS